MGRKEQILNRAQKYIQKGSLDKALAEYRAAIDIDPKDVSIRLRVGELFLRQGKKEDALKEFAETAKAQARQGFYLKAIAVYKQALKIDSANLDIHGRLAELYVKQRLTADAVAEYTFILNSFEKSGKKADALELLKKMVEIDPDNTSLRLKIAGFYQRLGYARDAFNENLKVLRTLVSSGNAEKAEKLMLEFKNSHPSEPEVLEGLCELYKAGGEQQKFLSCAGELLGVYTEKGDAHKAKSLSMEVLRINPADKKARGFLKTVGVEDASAAPLAGAEELKTETPPEGREAEPSEKHGKAVEREVAREKTPPEEIFIGEGVSPEAPPQVPEKVSAEEYLVPEVHPPVSELTHEQEPPVAGSEKAREEDIEVGFEGFEEETAAPSPAAAHSGAVAGVGSEEKEAPSIEEAPGIEVAADEGTVEFPLPEAEREFRDTFAILEREVGFERDVVEEAPEETFEEPEGPQERAFPEVSPEQDEFAGAQKAPEEILEEPARMEDEHIPAPAAEAGFVESVEEKTPSTTGEPAGIEEVTDRVSPGEVPLAEVPEAEPEEVYKPEEKIVEEHFAKPEEISPVEEFPVKPEEISQVEEHGGMPEEVSPAEEHFAKPEEISPVEEFPVKPEEISPVEEHAEMPEEVSPAEEHLAKPEEISPIESPPEEAREPSRIEAQEPFKVEAEVSQPPEAGEAAPEEVEETRYPAEFAEGPVDGEEHRVTPEREQPLVETGRETVGEIIAEAREEVQELIEPGILPEEAAPAISEVTGAGALKEAAEELKSEDEVKPEEEPLEETHYNLGIAYMEMELYKEASREFKFSAKAPRLEVASCLKLGVCAMEQHNPDEAVLYFLKALRSEMITEEERKEVMYHLSLAYDAEGSRAEAFEVMKLVNHMDPGFRDAASKLAEWHEDRAAVTLDDGLIEVELL